MDGWYVQSAGRFFADVCGSGREDLAAMPCVSSPLKKYPLVVEGESFRRIIREKRAVDERIRLPQPGRRPEPQFDKKGITKARKDENAKESASERMLAV
jgi:hypothetical protein